MDAKYYNKKDREAYTLIDGVLTKGNIIGTVTTVEKGSVVKESVLFKVDNSTVKRDPEEVFATVEDYKLGKYIKSDPLTLNSVYRNIQTDCTYWILRDGEPVCKSIRDSVLTVHYGDIENTLEIEGVPERRYTTREELFDHEDVVVCENGVRTVHQAPIKRLLLTDRQKEIMKKLQEVLECAQKEGIAMRVIDGLGLRAWNNPADAILTYDDSPRDEEHVVVYPWKDMYAINIDYEGEEVMIEMKK